MEGCAVLRFSRNSQGRARAREPHRNESGRADFSSSYFMEWRCVLGSSVWSTRTFARWAAGNNSARCRRLYSEAPPIRARYAGMAPGYSDANRRGRGSGTGAVRENGYRTGGGADAERTHRPKNAPPAVPRAVVRPRGEGPTYSGFTLRSALPPKNGHSPAQLSERVNQPNLDYLSASCDGARKVRIAAVVVNPQGGCGTGGIFAHF
jgi:hypothetical protein